MSFWDNEKEDSEEPEMQDLDDFTTISESEKWAMIHTDDADDWINVLNALEQFEIKGYDFVAWCNDNMLMRKR